MKITVRKGLVAAVVAATLVALTVGSAGAQTMTSTEFYAVPSPLPSGSPGTIIRTLPSTYGGGTSGVTSTRVMYLSTGENNTPMAVTGTILVPQSPWTGSGSRPIVAYAPFTMGMGQQCATSETMNGEGSQDIVSGVQNAFVNALLQKGMAVAETDYVGEGETGADLPQFVMRVPQGDAVLDVLRAARNLPGTGLDPNAPLGIEGYSEGGNAAAAAAELAASYAPDLHISGVYAGAVPADLGQLASTLDGGLYVAFLGDALVGIANAYPSSNLLSYANQTGVNDFKGLLQSCTLTSIFQFPFTQSSSLTKDGRPISAYISQEPFKSIVAENDLGNVAPSMPVEVESASNDDVIPNAQVKTMAKSWCTGGAKVQYNDIPSFTPVFSHALASFAAAGNSANYLNQVFSGQTQGNCGQF